MKLMNEGVRVGVSALACGLGLNAATAAVEATPESQGVSSAAIGRWIDACERTLDELHGFVIRRHGRVIAEGTWAPYDTLKRPHRLYSHSKSFTSTAVGFVVDEGKLDLDERVIDILPDKAPANPSENVRQLRVRDLLTMNVGASTTDAENGDIDGDWEKAFLANTLQKAPGTQFRYDSGATYLCAAIVERKTGRKMMDYLGEKLFQPLGMTSPRTTFSPSGTPCGGWGMEMTTGDLAKFGQLYLDKGLWNGRRILSEEWITLATARQTWSGAIAVTGEDGSDWHQGYGFQFWRCRHGAYRADGANGQYTIVFPKEDAVVSIHAGCGDMQKEINVVWEHLLPAFGPQALPDDTAARDRLLARCRTLALKPVSGKPDVKLGESPFCGIDFALKPNKYKFRSLRFDATADDGSLTVVSDEMGRQSIPVGRNCWKKGELQLRRTPHEPLCFMSGVNRTAASAAVLGNGNLRLRAPFLNGPQRLLLDFSVDTNGVRQVKGEFWGISGEKLVGQP